MLLSTKILILLIATSTLIILLIGILIYGIITEIIIPRLRISRIRYIYYICKNGYTKRRR